MDKTSVDSTSSRGTYVIATVKGDVHDIGKNIVSVILACNGYKVIDLGVMISCEQIIKAIQENNATIVGLSGLITPSLDEMILNAKEFNRLGINIPLMIGGATTSNAHTALKIATEYQGPTIRIGDASLVIEAASNLTNKNKKEKFVKELQRKQQSLREHYSNNKSNQNIIAFIEATDNPYKLKNIDFPKPEETGIFTEQNISLEAIIPYIDWSPFFWTWNLKGTYPKILEHPKIGEQATTLYQDAQLLLKDILKNNIFRPKYTYGIFPANRDGNDIHIYSDLNKKEHLQTFHFLRQQEQKDNDTHFYCLSDFLDSNKQDNNYLGAFAVTTGFEVEKHAQIYVDKNDDYSAILVKSLGDRFAEALAEMLHHKVRQMWGNENEHFDIHNLIKEKYKGIRPAPGYPSCPDHSEKILIWEALNIKDNLGIELTENCAINPPSSISGFYFSHPEAKYFTLGKIAEDQVNDYAQRKSMDKKDVERWVRPNLSYNT